MTIKELKQKGYKILPYTSAEEAFLHFIENSRSFASNGNSTLFHNGREDTKTGLKPRELFCLAVIANVANFLSGNTWTPAVLVDSNGSALPGDIAHDGFIKCIDGTKKNQFMWFEQVMATSKAKDATPDNIEAAILTEANRKSSRGSDYGIDEMALIIFTDYSGELNDLKALSREMQTLAYKAVYLIAKISESTNDCVCVILKNPSDMLGPISVRFSHPNGKADVERML